MIIQGEGSLATLEWNTRCRFEHAVARADDIGINVVVSSTRRDRDEQQRLWDLWQECKGIPAFLKGSRCQGVLPAAAPGTSAHEFGLAVDATPVCTQRYAEWRESQFITVGGSSTPSPQQAFNPTGALNPQFGNASCATVPTVALWADWHRILRESCLEVPLPSTDRPHAQLPDFPRLLAAGLLT